MPHPFRRYLSSFIAFLLLVISPGAFAQFSQNLVGFWWKPTESGWGLTIQQQGSSTFAVWFTYDTQGAATWYTLTCNFVGSICAGDLYTGSGTPLLQITGSANLVATKVGTGVITTTAANRLSLGYTIGSVTQTKTNLEPQNFVAAEQIPFCSLQVLSGIIPRAGLTNYTDHWWGGTNASGWGLQISHQGNQVFAGWYSYNAQGTATWLTAIGTQDVANDRHFTGSLYVVNPGIPFSTINGPVPQSSVIPAGTFELNFSDGERGTFTWSIPVPGQGLLVRPLGIERFAVAGGALNVCTVNKTATISGRVVASQDTATPVAGARIVDRQTQVVLATTDATGSFQINSSNNAADPPLNVSILADGYLARETGLQPGTQGVVADIIKLSPPFSLNYYRKLVRPASDGSDQKPGFALGGWRAASMNVYIRTNLIDPTDRTRPPLDTGVAVSQEAINLVLKGLEKTITEIAGGTVKIGLVESGPEAAHESQPGWLAIDFFDALNHPQPDYVGIAGTGTNGSALVRLGLGISSVSPIPGYIHVSSCGPLPLPQGLHQGLAMHELGHVFGLLHAEMDSPNVMLRAGATMPCADVHFSPAERLHGRIAFSRPRGNEDPDRDPVGFVLPGTKR